jgi:hypothetical protein
METKPPMTSHTVRSAQINSDRPGAIHGDQDREVIRREMPVNADGHAIGPTKVHYATGQCERWAYYASCCCCKVREPFFSPSDRDAWAEVHRAERSDHAMQLTAEPWDLRTPPWVAADGLPLTPPRSLTR